MRTIHSNNDNGVLKTLFIANINNLNKNPLTIFLLKLIKSRFSTFIYCTLIAYCVCLLSPLNPLSNAVPGTDSGVFLTIARGMTNGKIPYRDFFDHKGPLLYAFNYIGWLVAETLGVWIIELILMSVSILFAYKTLRLFVDKTPAHFGVFFGFASLVPFFDGGNMTEEYVLPFIFISLYIFTRCILDVLGNKSVNSIFSIILGVCFGCSLMLRPNMFAIWAVFCPILFLRLLFQKQFKSAFLFALLFASGAIIIILPFLVYLLVNGAMKDFIFQYIIFNFQYANVAMTNNVLVKNIKETLSKSFFWIALSGSLLGFRLIKRVGARTLNGICFIASIATVGFISFSRANYQHYCMVMVPFIILQVGLFLGVLFEIMKGQGNNVKTFFCMILIPFFIFIQVFSQWYSLTSSSRRPSGKDDLRMLSEIIDDNSDRNDTILVLGNDCKVYLNCNLEPTTKYIYQLPPVSLSEEIAKEFKSEMADKPASIFVTTRGNKISSYTEYFEDDFFESNVYEELLTIANYTLYKRK